MSRILTESQAQEDFSELITAACNGEEIIIEPDNMPSVRLTLIATPVTKKDIERQALIKRREKAIAAIKELRKTAVIGLPMTIEEIISARDEGRKYL